MAAHGDDDPVRLPAATVVDGDRVGVDESGRTGSFDQLDAGAAHVVTQVFLVVGILGDASGVVQRGCQVHLRARSPQPEGGPGLGVTDQPGGSGEGANRRWTPVQAGPPELVGLDQRDLSIELSCLQGRVEAGRPATKYQ